MYFVLCRKGVKHSFSFYHWRLYVLGCVVTSLLSLLRGQQALHQHLQHQLLPTAFGWCVCWQGKRRGPVLPEPGHPAFPAPGLPSLLLPHPQVASDPPLPFLVLSQRREPLLFCTKSVQFHLLKEIIKLREHGLPPEENRRALITYLNWGEIHITKVAILKGNSSMAFSTFSVVPSLLLSNSKTFLSPQKKPPWP